MASLWQSFVGVLTPGWGLACCGAVNPNHMIGGTLALQTLARSCPTMGEPSSRRIPVDPRVDLRRRAMPESDSEGEDEFQDSREDQPPRGPMEPAPVLDQAGSVPRGHLNVTAQGGGQLSSQEGEDMVEDLVEDAKFYQDAAVQLQGAYEELYQKQVKLQHNYEEQSNLLKEALAAIKAVEAEAKQRHQDLLDVQHNKQQEFNQAILGAVEQYKVQLNTAQSNLQAWDWEHQLTIK